MKGWIVSAIVLICCLNSGYSAPPATEPSFDRCLTAADIEKAIGLAGVKAIARQSKPGATGQLNFVTRDGYLLLMVQFENADLFNKSKAMKSYFKGSLPGIGEEAFFGPAADPQYILYFRKGKYCVSLSSFFNFAAGGKPYLAVESLSKLARIIAVRL
jgi:hypothetical protein